MEFASGANGVKIAAQCLQLHLQFSGSRWVFLSQHHKEDLLWEPLLQPALEVGDRLEQGLQEHPTQTALAFATPVFELLFSVHLFFCPKHFTIVGL